MSRAMARPAAGVVHVWTWSLASDGHDTNALLDLLSADEQLRMSRFFLVVDKARYLVARSRLRVILAACAGTSPRALRFDYGAHGKPALSPVQAAIHFNLSHSGDRAALAVSVDGPVGIDVEQVRDIDIDVAEPIFSAHEMTTLKGLEPGRRLRGFYNGWTRKEAVCKAEGLGLGLPTTGFSVTLAPGEPAALVGGRGCLSRPWRLHDLAMVDGWVGALATTHRIAEVSQFGL